MIEAHKLSPSNIANKSSIVLVQSEGRLQNTGNIAYNGHYYNGTLWYLFKAPTFFKIPQLAFHRRKNVIQKRHFHFYLNYSFKHVKVSIVIEKQSSTNTLGQYILCTEYVYSGKATSELIFCLKTM